MTPIALRITRRATTWWLAATFAAILSPAASKLNVVTSTEDLAAIVREVGGDRVAVQAIAKGYQDPHYVEPKPSFLLMLRRADLLVVVGRELESGWLPPLMTQSRNSRIQMNSGGYFDASLTCEVLDMPTGTVTRAMGDVHPLGNPHYWLDPENGRRVAKALAEKFSGMRPDDAGYFAGREADFEKRLTAAQKGWEAKMAPYRGRKVVTYHRSFSNFAKAFGISIVDYVEPKPGIPPTPAHTFALINMMKRDGIKLIMVEPYFDLRTPDSVAEKTGGTVLVMPPSVGGLPEIKDYFQLFDYNVNLLTTAFAKYK